MKEKADIRKYKVLTKLPSMIKRDDTFQKLTANQIMGKRYK